MFLIGIPLLVLGAAAAVSEDALIALAILCVALTVLCAAVGNVWQFAIIKEKDGWKGIALMILMSPLSYWDQHWDRMCRPVCLMFGGLLFLLYLLVPLSIYALMNP